ncbi:MAG: tetratricopeptide repeat protein, partial [Nannocystaceae bacterium]|nr:tetratricopeptide repeat protein [Nannocystaceae bacterium]
SSLALRLAQPSLRARALVLRSDAVDQRGNATLALELLEQAYFVANANDLELLAINTSQQMAPTHASLGHNEQALRWLEIAEAEAKRASRVEVQPHMLAAIRARTYMHLGRYDDAHREADAALADLRADDTSVGYTRLMVISTLAAILTLKGVPAQERLPVTQERLELSLKLYGPEHPDVAVAYEDMATIHSETGGHSKAIEMLERARAIHIGVTGPDNLNLVALDNKLATNQQALGNLDDAEASYRRALETQSILRTPTSSSQINLESNLGTLLQQRGKSREALRHQERALTLSEEAFGSNGIKTAMVRLNLADVLSNFEDTRRGIVMLEAAGVAFEQGLPQRHPAVVLTALSLSLAYIRAGRLDDAETALSKARSVSGDDPMSAGHLAAVSATLLEAQGATEQAIERSGECVEFLSEKPGYIERLKCLHRASRLLLETGRRDAAYGLLQPELGAIRASTADPRVRAHLLETLARSEHDPAAARELASEALKYTDGTDGGDVAALRGRLEARLRRNTP